MMSDNGTVLSTPPAKVESKTRIITLTHRAPIRIVEDEWPVIAQGGCGFENEYGYGWSITIRVRSCNKPDNFFGPDPDFGKVIIHANYDSSGPHEEEDQSVRVGRVLAAHEDLSKHILAVADELKLRIENERHRKLAIHAIDRCFAELSPSSRIQP